MAAATCSRSGAPAPSPKTKAPLISATTTMMTAWHFRRNPMTDPRWTIRSYRATSSGASRSLPTHQLRCPHLAPGKMSCNNCHLNGGQREKSLPLVAVAGTFPEYNRRAGRLYTLADRVVDCFIRSENATGATASEGQQTIPTPTSKRGTGRFLLISPGWHRDRGWEKSSLARPEHDRNGQTRTPVGKLIRRGAKRSSCNTA